MLNKIFGKNIEELAKKYGTPFFLFSEKKLVENYFQIKRSFSKYHKKVRIDYSVKTDNEIAILKIIKKIGSSVEVFQLMKLRCV